MSFYVGLVVGGGGYGGFWDGVGLVRCVGCVVFGVVFKF